MIYHRDNVQTLLVLVIPIITILFPGFGSVLADAGARNGQIDTIDAWKNEFEEGLLLGKIPVNEKCLAFFKDYITYAGEFSRCELKYAVPFRMCDMCVDKYVITSATYKDLVTDEDLKECRMKYMQSDRVQIFPLVEKNMEDVWNEADCKGCFENLELNHTTKAVTYDRPKSIITFMELYINLSICMNSSLEINDIPIVKDYNIDVCTVCLDNYTALNEHYSDMSSHFDGDVCMDIVDRMNYTRLIWSHHFNCSCRSSEPAAIIAIALVIASAPIFFYIIVRVTGKEKKKKLLKQKRLNLSGRSMNSNSIHQSLWRPNNYRNYHSLADT